MTVRPSLRGSGIALLAALVLAAPAAADPGWAGEVGAYLGSHDNFFFRGPDSAAPSSGLLSGSLLVERLVETRRSEWTFGLAASAVSIVDIDGADYQTAGLQLEYKRGAWKAGLTHEMMLNRLFSESGDAVFFDQSALEFYLRYSLGPRLWLRLKAEAEELDFGQSQDGRDADADKYTLTLRWAATPRLGVRLSWLSEERLAREPENSRTGSGYGVALEGSPREDLTWFLRYRSRDRDYEDAPPDENNFGRRDTVEDINFNIRWRFGDAFGLMLRDTYRSGDSTRPDRNFSGNAVEAGVFYQFSSGQ